MIQSTLADLAAAGMTVFTDAGVAVTLESLKAWILKPRPKKVSRDIHQPTLISFEFFFNLFINFM